ncbi:MAG: glycosyl hydrolase family 8, partial [Treponema sp.]|nr:glycosyl hydrolase family 8 [Treponema sp.]
IAVLLAVLLPFGMVLQGCASTATGSRPFPQQAAAGFTVAPTMPRAVSRAQITAMTVNLFRRILENDLVVDSGGPQTAADFRLALRHFQEAEVAEGSQPVSHIATSESHGYGMLMLVLMAGSEKKLTGYRWIFGSSGLQDYFDAMLRTVQAFPSSGSGLFTWRLWGYRENLPEDAGPGGFRYAAGLRSAPFSRDGNFANSFTEGDMDIIYSLILADRQWGSDGRYDYLSIARSMLGDLWKHCVSDRNRFLLQGDWVKGFPDPIHGNAARSSSLIISHLVAFRDVDPEHNWQEVIDASFRMIMQVRDRQNALGRNNGLLPDYMVLGSGGWDVPAGNMADFVNIFGFDAVRVPWRLGTSYLLLGNVDIGNSTLYDYVIGPLDDFARAFPGGLDALGPVGMSGTAMGAAPNWFAPPFAVTAMAAGADPQWIDSFWKQSKNGHGFRGMGSYQGDTCGDYIRLLVLLVLGGNYWMP